jgi:hypothetical protein
MDEVELKSPVARTILGSATYFWATAIVCLGSFWVSVKTILQGPALDAAGPVDLVQGEVEALLPGDAVLGDRPRSGDR